MDDIFSTILEEVKAYSGWLPFIFIAWGIVDTIILSRFDGKIKRGFRIWRKPLSREIRNYLSSLTVDVAESQNSFLSNRRTAFIRVENNQALIYARRLGWKTSWPYVGYVDLSEYESFLEFRASLPMHLILLPFLTSGIPGIFIMIMMIINYYVETKAIENFLKRKSKE